MKFKKGFMFMTVVLLTISFTIGCSNNKKVEEKPQEEETKGKCVVTECIKQLETTNTIEEINEIIGFEGTKSEYSEEYTWKLNSKNYIMLKYAGDSPILQATIDKETIKNENVKLPLSSELREMLNNGSFTYEELVEKLGGIEGVLNSKTSSSVGYIWVDKHNQALSATFNNKTGKCTIASYR